MVFGRSVFEFQVQLAAEQHSVIAKRGIVASIATCDVSGACTGPVMHSCFNWYCSVCSVSAEAAPKSPTSLKCHIELCKSTMMTFTSQTVSFASQTKPWKSDSELCKSDKALKVKQGPFFWHLSMRFAV